MPREAFELEVDGQKVIGETFAPVGAYKHAVLFLHGWTGRPNVRAAEVLVENGYYVMTLVFRGHPGSDGDITKIVTQESLDDAKAAYDLLRSKITAGTPIVVVGSSYGSYIASLLSAEREVEALSLRVPANYTDDGYDLPKWGRGHEDPVVAAWRLQPLNSSGTKSLQAVHDFSGKIQIFEAEQDEIIPHQAVKNYVDAVSDQSKLEHQLMKGWPHSLGDNEPRNKEFQTILLEWLNRL